MRTSGPKNGVTPPKRFAFGGKADILRVVVECLLMTQIGPVRLFFQHGSDSPAARFSIDKGGRSLVESTLAVT